MLIAASALAFDARREMEVFLRTRVSSVRSIVLPAYGITTVGVVAGRLTGPVCEERSPASPPAGPPATTCRAWR